MIMNRADINNENSRSRFIPNGSKSPGPADYNYKSQIKEGFSFNKESKHFRSTSSNIGPGHYDVDA